MERKRHAQHMSAMGLKFNNQKPFLDRAWLIESRRVVWQLSECELAAVWEVHSRKSRPRVRRPAIGRAPILHASECYARVLTAVSSIAF